MQSIESLHRHLGSMFVIAAFLDDFGGGISTNIAMTIGRVSTPSMAKFYTHSANAAFPLASVLGAAHDVCSNATVTDEESLEEMLKAVRKQFDIVDECDETDAKLALENLEHVFAIASQNAREALKEVHAGFPTSGGDFALWKSEVFWRHHRDGQH